MPRKLSPEQKREHLRERVATNSQELCSVDGCEGLRYYVSKWCKTHKDTADRTGHPRGYSLRPYQLKQYRQCTRRWLKKHAQDRAVLPAIWFLEDLLTQRPRGPAKWRAGLSVADRVHFFLDNLRDAPKVSGTRLLEIVIAVHVMREVEPRFFKSDRAFLFQLTKTFLQASRRGGGETLPAGRQARNPVFGVKVIEVVGKKLTDNIGVTAYRAATQIVRDYYTVPGDTD